MEKLGGREQGSGINSMGVCNTARGAGSTFGFFWGLGCILVGAPIAVVIYSFIQFFPNANAAEFCEPL